MDDTEDCCFVVDKTYNANRGPTDKQSDESPFDAKLRKAIEARVGPATSPQSGMEMSDKPLIATD